MLSETTVHDIVNRALSSTLGPHGFLHAEVRSGDDDLGDSSLFVTAVFAPGSSIVRGDAFGDALVDFRARLRDAGETRFPYFDVKYARVRA